MLVYDLLLIWDIKREKRNVFEFYVNEKEPKKVFIIRGKRN